MDTDTIPANKKAHHGHNVRRIREFLGIKQEALADGIGVSQSTISRMETEEVLDEKMMKEIANFLNVPVEALKNMSDEAIINIISNTFQDDSSLNNYTNHYKCTFNPIDKIVELYDEKMALYERMLKSEQEKVALLEKQQADRK